MSALKAEISSRQADANTPVEASSNSTRAEWPSSLMALSRVEAPVKPGTDTIGTLIEKVGATSIAEIEKLIGDLQVARTFLKSEGERLQKEMSRFAHLNTTASDSVKVITESLGRWRNGNDALRTPAT
jgi:hypothetical protein